MNRITRLSLGTAVGLVVGVLGPALYAVANHTGNLSGNEPLVTRAAATQHETAEASWSAFGITHSFEVNATSETVATADTTAQRAGRGRTGTAVARQVRCDGDDCITRTWRGDLSSPYAEGTYFTVDPALRYATFNGWLQNEDSGVWCKFQVNWRGTVAPAAGGDQETETGEHAASGALRGRVSGAARTEVVARCWNADGIFEFGTGSGYLISSTTVAGAAREDLGSAHFNRPCDPSLEQC